MKKSNTSILLLSLFSGCGGMDLGFEGNFKVLKSSVNKNINPSWNTKDIDENWTLLPKTIFQTCFANDIRPGAKIAWTNYFNSKDPSIYHLESIVDLVKKHNIGEKNVFPKNIDIITGGFPCQDFSIAGKRKGFNSNKSHDGKIMEDSIPTIENRGHLYMWMREVINIVKPKIFIAENVKGLVNLSNVKDIIEQDFASIADGGYLVIPAKVLHAAKYGVPQNRERVIFFGFRKNALKEKALKELSKEKISTLYDPYPFETHYLEANKLNSFALTPFVTVKEAFINLLEPEESKDLSQKVYSKAKFMGKHCQGQNEVQLNHIAPTIRSEHHGNIEFRRLSSEHGGNHKDELEAGLKERRLTIRECARIQTFPDEYQFIIKSKDKSTSLSGSESYKLIGNAVPPLLAFHIAKRLEDNWNIYFK